MNVLLIENIKTIGDLLKMNKKPQQLLAVILILFPLTHLNYAGHGNTTMRNASEQAESGSSDGDTYSLEQVMIRACFQGRNDEVRASLDPEVMLMD